MVCLCHLQAVGIRTRTLRNPFSFIRRHRRLSWGSAIGCCDQLRSTAHSCGRGPGDSPESHAGVHRLCLQRRSVRPGVRRRPGPALRQRGLCASLCEPDPAGGQQLQRLWPAARLRGRVGAEHLWWRERPRSQRQLPVWQLCRRCAVTERTWSVLSHSHKKLSAAAVSVRDDVAPCMHEGKSSGEQRGLPGLGGTAGVRALVLQPWSTSDSFGACTSEDSAQSLCRRCIGNNLVSFHQVQVSGS